MNDDRFLERKVTTVLTSVAPTREPANLLASVLASSSHTRQRPRWLTFSKEPPMRLGADVAFGSPIARLAYVTVLLLTVVAVTAGTVAVGASLLPSPSPAIVVPAPYPPGPGTFAAGPQMAEAGGVRAIRLLDDSVLVVGGPTVERWDPATGRFETLGTMLDRTGGPAVLLQDGRVLVVGGQHYSPEPGGGERVATAQLWDPATKTFAAAGSMAHTRGDHSLVVLRDGRVLVVGGTAEDESMPMAEIWDPVTQAFEPAGSMVRPSGDQTAILLADDQVAVIDGTHAEIWDPLTESFSEAGTMIHPRLWTRAVALADGRVLVVGGPASQGGTGAVSIAEVWDAESRTFTEVGSMAAARYIGHSLTRLPDGRILVVGGSVTNPWLDVQLASSEIWDPLDGTFSPGADLLEGRGLHAAALLADGTVLIAGGFTGDLDDHHLLATTEIWAPGPGA